jgi:MFS family permease
MHSPIRSSIDRAGGLNGWYVVFVLQLGYLVSFIDRTLMSLLVVPIEIALHLDDRALALLQGAAFGIFYASMGYPMGLLVDRLNRRNLIVAGSSIWCFATAASGLARGFTALFSARLAIGFGEAALSPAAVSLLSDLFPPARRATAVSAYQMAGSVGVGLALILGGQAIESLGGSDRYLPVIGLVQPWQIAFLVVGLSGLIVPALMLLTVSEPRRAGADEKSGANDSGGAKDTGEVWRFLAAHRRVLGLHFLGFSAINTLSYGQLAWTPEFFRRGFGWSTGEIGLRYGLVFLVFGAAGALAGGFAATRLYARGRRDAPMRAMAIGAFGLAVFAPLAPLSASGWGALALYGPVIFFFAFPSGVSLAALSNITPGHLRGRIVALYFVSISLTGIMLGPSIVSELELFLGDGSLGLALAIDAVVLAPIAVICFVANLSSYRAALVWLDKVHQSPFPITPSQNKS